MRQSKAICQRTTNNTAMATCNGIKVSGKETCTIRYMHNIFSSVGFKTYHQHRLR